MDNFFWNKLRSLQIEYPDTRGPICFDCENVADPADCHTVTPCNLNQVRINTVVG